MPVDPSSTSSDPAAPRRAPLALALAPGAGVAGALVVRGLAAQTVALVGALPAAAMASIVAVVVGVAVGALLAGSFDGGARATRGGVAAWSVLGLLPVLGLTWSSFVPPAAGATAAAFAAGGWMPAGIALGFLVVLLASSSGPRCADAFVALSFGGVIGLVVDAGVLLPTFGARGALVSGAVLAGVLALATTRLPPLPSSSTQQAAPSSSSWGRAGLALAAAAGFAPAGGLVVVVMQLASATLGRSTTAHATTLAAIGAGIAVGTFLGAWSTWRASPGIDDRRSSSSLLLPLLSPSLALALVGAALAVTWTALLWDRVPAWFNAPPRPSSWVAGEGFRFGVALLLLGPAAAAFAALPAWFSRGRAFDGTRPSSSWGAIVAGSAAGLGGGAVVTVVVVLPALGARGVVTIVALALLLVASVVAAVARGARGADATSVWASSVALATVAVLLPDWNGNALLSADATRFRAAFTGERSRVVARLDDDAGIVSVVRRTPPRKKRATGKEAVTTVLFDGVVVGDDGRGAFAEARRAVVALAHVNETKRAFVDGSGSGRGVAVLVAAGFVDVDVVAPSSTLVEQVRTRLRRAHRGVFDQAPVHTVVDDGVVALARATAHYDLIAIDVPPLTAAGGARRVSRRFLSTAQARLQDDGVLVLSLPLDGVAPDDVAAVVVTARAVFASVAVFVVGDRCLVVAGARLPDDLAARPSSLAATPALARLIDAGFDVQATRVLSGADVDALVSAHPALVIDDDAVFAAAVAKAAWMAGGARATLAGLWSLLPADLAAARQGRLDSILPPRTRKTKAKAATATTAP